MLHVASLFRHGIVILELLSLLFHLKIQALLHTLNFRNGFVPCLSVVPPLINVLLKHLQTFFWTDFNRIVFVHNSLLDLLRSLSPLDISPDPLFREAVQKLLKVGETLLSGIVTGVFAFKILDVWIRVHFHQEVDHFEPACANEVA
jgi:hypothetical protein